MRRITDRPGVARWFHGLTAISVAFAVVAQLGFVFVDVEIGFGEGPQPFGRRIVEFFSYFTIQSNILVGVAAAMLTADPWRDGDRWRVVRLASLLGITITFVVYQVVLAPLADFHGLAAVTNVFLHAIVPVLAIVGWLVFGPRPRISSRTLIWTAVWPAAYIVYTAVHGVISGFYPYPFVNLRVLGVAVVARNGLIIVGLFLISGSLFRWLDGRLPAVPSAVSSRDARP